MSALFSQRTKSQNIGSNYFRAAAHQIPEPPRPVRSAPQPMAPSLPSPSVSRHLPSYRLSFENRRQIIAKVAVPALRQPLTEVMLSNWWRENVLEPEDELSKFILPESRTRFRCRANDCDRIFSRKDRAINHFRSHIDHRPYSCNGQCEVNGWYVLVVFSEASWSNRLQYTRFSVSKGSLLPYK